MVLLARKDEEGNTQTLYDHLHGAGRLASGFEDEFADISRTAAVLHDVGKVAQQFQTYLLSDDGHRGDVQHARQGAFVVNDFFESKGEIEEIAKEILELAISKHHGGLPDCIDESGNRAFLLGFTESDKSNEKYAYQEIKRGLNGLALDLQSNFRGSAEDIACFLKKIKSLGMSKDSIYFYLGLLVKLIYSRLVDADRTDAACFETQKQYRPNTVDWQNLISRLDKSMRSFDSSSEINRIRHQINEQCCLAGARETGIYRLSIPTGGGKTLASLNFALHHALKTGKHRIIYVIPYLSITTQTAKTFRDVLGLNADSDVLLEHYSTAGMQRSADVADNASSEFEDAGEHQRKLAAERWDNPIIVTTMVEFLETVMSARGTKLRKFHNMADSVIIFDEIQSLPMNTINLFNEIVSFLSKITNSTILLCSATQPLLEKTKRENLLLSEKPDLIAETESYEDKLRRTRIVASTENKSCDELGQIIYQQARKNGNCLAIVNLKREAREIFQCLGRLDVNHEFELIHLSTAMCGRHRTDCLNGIGALLDPGNPKPVICVSTQLIEAGVDISFACVVRAMAGLDSIMQAAGRCNRNGESVEWKAIRKRYDFNHYSDIRRKGFDFFMLNRMNVSGIIKGGPIGGAAQDGKYNISSRFNKSTLKKRIERIAAEKERITVSNLEASHFFKLLSDGKFCDMKNSLIFADPPYYVQGRNLYNSYATATIHSLVAKRLVAEPDWNWILTYDKAPQICRLYSDKNVKQYEYQIAYSANKRGYYSEYMFASRKMTMQSYANVTLSQISDEGNNTLS